MAATIEQLTSKQSQMLQMLEKLAAGSSARDEQLQQMHQAITHANTQQQQQQQNTSSLQSQAPDATAAGAAPSVAASTSTTGIPAAIAAIPELTRLHNEVLRSSKDFDQHRQSMHQLLQQLVNMDAAAAQAELKQRLQLQNIPIAEFVYKLYQLLLSFGTVIPCREDSTLVLGDTALAATSNRTTNSSSNSSSSTAVPKYYFATNLRDNSVQMPHFTLNLLMTLLQLPRDAAFVSVYESNSDQGAHGWVDVMQLALNVIGTPSRLVTRGMLVRLEGQHRIEYLAQVAPCPGNKCVSV
jgi:hypothetical protein